MFGLITASGGLKLLSGGLMLLLYPFLKTCFNAEDYACLFSENEILKKTSVPGHDNVLKLIGVCTLKHEVFSCRSLAFLQRRSTTGYVDGQWGNPVTSDVELTLLMTHWLSYILL